MNYKVTIETTDKDFVEGIQDIAEDYVEDSDGTHDFAFMTKSYIGDEYVDCEGCGCCDCCEEEEEYELKGLGFGIAFDFLIENPEFGMRLPCWGKDRVIRIQYPDENNFMTHPYLYIETEHENIPFVVDYMSLFSNDWEIVE